MLSNVAFAAGRFREGDAVDKRSDVNSAVGSVAAANSAMANSDMDAAGMPDSDNSYAEL